MSANQKKKLCWNCEGRVSFTQENCPYCGVYLSPAAASTGQSHENQLAPPYKLASDDDTVPQPPYATTKISSKQSEEQALAQTDLQELESDSEFKQLVIAMCSLIIGSGLALFGLVLYLFSDGGSLLLRWEASYWYAYLLLALPLLAIGWRSLRKF